MNRENLKGLCAKRKHIKRISAIMLVAASMVMFLLTACGSEAVTAATTAAKTETSSENDKAAAKTADTKTTSKKQSETSATETKEDKNENKNETVTKTDEKNNEDPVTTERNEKTEEKEEETTANTGNKTHKHSYTAKITKQPTCTKTGVTTYTCSCGDTYTETISELGHEWVAHEEPVYTTIHHDAVTHEEPVYETVWQDEVTHMEPYYGYRDVYSDWYTVHICLTCWAEYDNAYDLCEHTYAAHGGSGTKTEQRVDYLYTETFIAYYYPVVDQPAGYVQKQTGTETVVDEEAYDEQVQTGTKTVEKCSRCGATK